MSEGKELQLRNPTQLDASGRETRIMDYRICNTSDYRRYITTMLYLANQSEHYHITHAKDLPDTPETDFSKVRKVNGTPRFTLECHRSPLSIVYYATENLSSLQLSLASHLAIVPSGYEQLYVGLFEEKKDGFWKKETLKNVAYITGLGLLLGPLALGSAFYFAHRTLKQTPQKALNRVSTFEGDQKRMDEVIARSRSEHESILEKLLGCETNNDETKQLIQSHADQMKVVIESMAPFEEKY